MTKAKNVLTTGEIAEYCGVNFRTVIRWIERGQLNSYKLPGRGDNRVRISDFLNFLKANNMPIPEELRDGRRSVLVVDDDRSMARAIARVLRKADCEIEIAEDGFQAGTKLMAFTPRLMTLDLSMPGLDGFQVLEFVRTQYPKPLKVLVLSARDEEALQRAKAAGAQATMSKPFDNRALVDTVNRLLEE